MRKVLIIVVAIAAVVGVRVWRGEDVATPFAESTPRAAIRFDVTRFDFGSATHGETVSHVFRFESTGEADLEIGSLRPSCGCTVVACEPRRVPPGGEGHITLAFDTTKKPAQRERQRFANHVLVTTNAVDHGTVRLDLEGDVVSRYRTIPASGAILQPTPRGDHIVPARVEVRPFTDDAGLIANARLLAVPASLVVEGPFAIATGDRSLGFAFVVRPAPDAQPGPVHDVIRFATNDPLQPIVCVPVIGHIPASVRATPAILAIPRRLDRPVTVTLTAREAGVRVLAADAFPDDGGPAPIAIRLPKTLEMPAKLELTVRAEAAVASAQRGELRFRTTDPRTPIVVVPYRIRDLDADRKRIRRAEDDGLRMMPGEIDAGTVPAGETREAMLTLQAVGSNRRNATGDLVREAGGTIDPILASVRGDDRVSAAIETIAAGVAMRLRVSIAGGRTGPFFAVLAVRARPGGIDHEIEVRGEVQGPARNSSGIVTDGSDVPHATGNADPPPKQVQ